MTSLEIVQQLKSSKFTDQDGETYSLEFLPGLTGEEIQELKERFPANKIADELQEILLFTKGWDGYSLDTVYFDSIDEFGFTELVPHSLTLGGDGFGNFWVLEIKQDGSMGKVYYACHDPAVFIVFSETLHEFLQQLSSFYKNPTNSYLNEIHEKTVIKIWDSAPNIVELEEFKKANTELSDFLAKFQGDNWVVADLRNKSNREGFAWGKYGPNQLTERHPVESIWVLQKKRPGFFKRLFG